MTTSARTLRHRLAVAATVTFALIVVAGCGGATKMVTATETQPAATTTPPSTNTAADQRIASDALLKLADFPSGWEQQDKNQQSDVQAHCASVAAAKAATSARQTSPDFKASDGSTQATNATYVYADVPKATQSFSQLSGESTRRCIGDQLGKYLATQRQQGYTVGQITSGQVSMAPTGDESVLGRLTIPLTASGINVNVYADLVFVRAGRGVAIFTLEDVGSPFDEALRNKLTTTVVDRLKAGLAQST